MTRQHTPRTIILRRTVANTKYHLGLYRRIANPSASQHSANDAGFPASSTMPPLLLLPLPPLPFIALLVVLVGATVEEVSATDASDMDVEESEKVILAPPPLPLPPPGKPASLGRPIGCQPVWCVLLLLALQVDKGCAFPGRGAAGRERAGFEVRWPRFQTSVIPGLEGIEREK